MKETGSVFTHLDVRLITSVYSDVKQGSTDTSLKYTSHFTRSTCHSLSMLVKSGFTC
jgi:hypothetical protein